jgi:hypothetical protein
MAAGAWGWQPYRLPVTIVMKSGSLYLLEPPGPVQACTVVALPVPFTWLISWWDSLYVAYKATLAPWLDRHDLVYEGWCTRQNPSVITLINSWNCAAWSVRPSHFNLIRVMIWCTSCKELLWIFISTAQKYISLKVCHINFFGCLFYD